MTFGNILEMFIIFNATVLITMGIVYIIVQSKQRVEEERERNLKEAQKREERALSRQKEIEENKRKIMETAVGDTEIEEEDIEITEDDLEYNVYGMPLKEGNEVRHVISSNIKAITTQNSLVDFVQGETKETVSVAEFMLEAMDEHLLLIREDLSLNGKETYHDLGVNTEDIIFFDRINTFVSSLAQEMMLMRNSLEEIEKENKGTISVTRGTMSVDNVEKYLYTVLDTKLRQKGFDTSQEIQMKVQRKRGTEEETKTFLEKLRNEA